MRLTDLTIRNLPAPAEGAVIHLCDTITGFGVRVSKGGTKSFVLTYGSDRKRITLGRYGIITLSQARDLARTHLAEITLGHRHATIRLQTLIERFLATKKETTRPKTYSEYDRLLKRHLTADDPLDDITPHRLTELFKKVEKPQERAHLVNVVKMMFRYAEGQQYIQRTPASGFSVTLPPPRERTLTKMELQAIWHACPDDDFGKTVKALMVTGCRRGEVEHLQLDGDIATLTAQHSKNKRSHSFPVPDLAVNLLATPLKWRGWGKSKVALDNASKVANWTIHDLRRTYSTNLAQLGTPPHIIEALLNHKTGIVSGVAATYNRYTYLPEMRQAVTLFETWFTSLLVSHCPD